MDVEVRPQPDPVEATPSGGRDTWFAKMTHITYADLVNIAELNALEGRWLFSKQAWRVLHNPFKWVKKYEASEVRIGKIYGELKRTGHTSPTTDDIESVIEGQVAGLDTTSRKRLDRHKRTIRILAGANFAVYGFDTAATLWFGFPQLLNIVQSIISVYHLIGLSSPYGHRDLSSEKRSVTEQQAGPLPLHEVPLDEVQDAQRVPPPVTQPPSGDEAAQPTPVPGEAAPPVEEVPVEAALGRRGRLRQTFMTVVGWYRRGRRWVEGTLGRERREQGTEARQRRRGEGVSVSLETYRKSIEDLSKDERLSFNEYALGIPAGRRHIFENTSGPLYGRLCNLGVAIYDAKRGYLEGRRYDFDKVMGTMRDSLYILLRSDGFDIAVYSQKFRRILEDQGYVQATRMELDQSDCIPLAEGVLREWLGDTLYEDFRAGLFASEELATVESLQTGGRGYGLEIGRYEEGAKRPASINEELFLIIDFLRANQRGDIATLLLDPTDTNNLYDPLYNFSQALFEMKRAYAREGDYNYGDVRILLIDFVRVLINHEDFNLDLCSPEFRELLRGREYQAEQAPRLNPENVAFVADYVLRACLGDSLYQEFVAREANEAAVIPQPRRGLMMVLRFLTNRVLGRIRRGERIAAGFSLGSVSLSLEDHLREAQSIAGGEEVEGYVIGSRRRVEIFGKDSNTEVLETSLVLCDRGLSRRLRRVGITQGNLGDFERRLFKLRQECQMVIPNQSNVRELSSGDFSFVYIDRLVRSSGFLRACGIRGNDRVLVNRLINESPFERLNLGSLELLLRLIHTTVVAGSFTIESGSHEAKISFGMVTTPGIELRRFENQDSIGARNYGEGARFVLADGVGGEKGGSYSSRFAVHRVLNSDMNVDIIDKCRVIDTELQKDLPEASTTFECVEVRLGDDGRLVFTPYHIGDSRQYWRGQITKDHSWIQGEIEQRRRTESYRFVAEKSSVILGYLGGAINILEKLKDIILGIGEVYTMCSDGWWELLRDVEGNEIEKFAKVNITTIARKALLSSDNTSLIRLWGVSIKPK